MKEINITINNREGLHARPVALFVKTAMEFKSQIFISKGDRVVDGRGIVSILALGVRKGAHITLRADGEDEAEAIDRLKNLIESNFGEL